MEFDRGQLGLRFAGGDELARAVQQVAQAVVRVSDVWFTFRMRTHEVRGRTHEVRGRTHEIRRRTHKSIADEVDTWLRERVFECERNVQRSGHSGKQWKVDYAVVTEGCSSLMFLLSSGSRASARVITNRVVAGCVDLSRVRTRCQNRLVSLFDDTSDVWQPEDFNLLQGVSETVMWSRPDHLERVLRMS